MPTPTDTTATFSATAASPPVEDQLRVHLGQSGGSRVPEPAVDVRCTPDASDLWDQLGDFA
jgi:hypothetical protein